MRLPLLVTLAVALFCRGGTARADYQYVFTDSSGTAASAFTVNQGSTIDIRVYLVETGGTTLHDTGLTSAGVQVNTGSPSIANASAVTKGSAWDSSTSTTGANAKLNVFQDVSAPVTAPNSGADANRILIGTFTFTALSNGTTSIITADPSSSNDTILANGTVIDGLITNSSAAITVTPEPGTVVLTGLLATGIGGAALRRLRRRAPAAV
jgi:hypothetical protein